MANATQEKFGYPASLIAQYDHWCVLLRPAQATLGALVLVCTDEATAFADISTGAFTELARVTADTETALKAFQPFDRINYLMLMMVDPDVHFHVLPRYEQAPEFAGTTYPDPGWPGPPALAETVKPEPEDFEALRQAVIAHWPAGQAGDA
jgi:diadenosine tetraphosphate (Ap4A) HIT family hydrolase